jgi:hypothetical protein
VVRATWLRLARAELARASLCASSGYQCPATQPTSCSSSSPPWPSASTSRVLDSTSVGVGIGILPKCRQSLRCLQVLSLGRNSGSCHLAEARTGQNANANPHAGRANPQFVPPLVINALPLNPPPALQVLSLGRNSGSCHLAEARTSGIGEGITVSQLMIKCQCQPPRWSCQPTICASSGYQCPATQPTSCSSSSPPHDQRGGWHWHFAQVPPEPALLASVEPGPQQWFVGSSWARIVSGSYDESILIWHKDRDNRWITDHQLRHSVRATWLRLARAELARASLCRS